jgi:dTMP kinase
MNGRLITLEGGEGAGKSTVLDAARARLESHGIDVVVTREPGGTALGEAVRAIVLDPARRDLCAESELLLMFAARAQLVRELIRPVLDAGRWVLSDRFTDASYAYQGGGRGQPEQRIEQENGDFFERVRATYRARAAAEPQRFRVIDASLPIVEVRAAACAAIDAFVAATSGRA